MKNIGYPRWVFDWWCEGAADLYCADDDNLPVSKARRWFWRLRGNLLMFLFQWWIWI